MKRSDLYREWARVLDMCEGVDVAPNACVRFAGTELLDPSLFNANPEQYSFALAIVEGRPVFAGDVLYCEDSTTIVVRGADKSGRLIADCDNGATNALYTIEFISRNPPAPIIKPAPKFQLGERVLYRNGDRGTIVAIRKHGMYDVCSSVGIWTIVEDDLVRSQSVEDRITRIENHLGI